MSLPADRAIPLLSPARDLLRRFAAAWAEDAARERAREGGILLVDAFAGADYPAPCALQPGVWAAAMRLLRDGRTRAVARVAMLEEDPAKVEWLSCALRHQLPGGAPPGDGEPSPPLEVVGGAPEDDEALAARIREAGRALVVLDPPAAGKLPLGLLSGWLEEGDAELLLRFPAADLHRLARYRGSTLADLPPQLKRTVEGISRFLGDARHGWLHAWTRALESGAEAAIEAIVALHTERVGREGLIVRRVALADAGWVLLLTRRPASALLLNRVVHGLREDGVLPWPETGAGAVRYPACDELPLFCAEPGGPATRERQVDRAQLARSIARRFAARSVPLDEVLRSYVDTDLFAEDLRRALLELRREGGAVFRSLGAASEILFPEAGARAMHKASPRKPRAQELILALDR